MNTNYQQYQRRLYPTRIDIPADVRVQVVELLNQTLAASTDLKTQVKQAHWNVKGMDFYQLHELFDEIATEVEDYTDKLAERITALAGYAVGTSRAAAQFSILPEYPFDINSSEDHVAALADRLAIYAKHLRQAIDKTGELGDADTNDLYVEVSRVVDMRLWFLEAHLQPTVRMSEQDGVSASAAVKEPVPVN